jgi:hypothetical protein
MFLLVICKNRPIMFKIIEPKSVQNSVTTIKPPAEFTREERGHLVQQNM